MLLQLESDLFCNLQLLDVTQEPQNTHIFRTHLPIFTRLEVFFLISSLQILPKNVMNLLKGTQTSKHYKWTVWYFSCRPEVDSPQPIPGSPNNVMWHGSRCCAGQLPHTNLSSVLILCWHLIYTRIQIISGIQKVLTGTCKSLSLRKLKSKSTNQISSI